MFGERCLDDYWDLRSPYFQTNGHGPFLSTGRLNEEVSFLLCLTNHLLPSTWKVDTGTLFNFFTPDINSTHKEEKKFIHPYVHTHRL